MLDGWMISAFETSPPNSIQNSIQSLFSMQTQFNQVLLHTLIPNHPNLAFITQFINFRSLNAETQSSIFFELN